MNRTKAAKHHRYTASQQRRIARLRHVAYHLKLDSVDPIAEPVFDENSAELHNLVIVVMLGDRQVLAVKPDGDDAAMCHIGSPNETSRRRSTCLTGSNWARYVIWRLACHTMGVE